LKKILKVIIRTESLEEFLVQARDTAQKADRGEFSDESVTFSFEDSREMFNKNPKEISFLQVGDEFRKAYISIDSTVHIC
jgi:hypothetical protein